MTCVLAFLLTHHTFQQGLNLIVALFVVWRLVEITTDVHLIDRHRDILDIPDVRERHLLRLSWQRHLEVVTQSKLGIGHLVALITEFG